MTLTFREIEKSDFLLIELSEKGVGLGIEVGYAYAKGAPIIIIAKTGSDISTTMQGVAKKVIFYDNIEELTGKLDPQIFSKDKDVFARIFSE